MAIGRRTSSLKPRKEIATNRSGRSQSRTNDEGLLALAFLLVFFVFVPPARALAVVAATVIVGYLLIRSRNVARRSSVAVGHSAVPVALLPQLALGTIPVSLAPHPSALPARLPYRARNAFFNWSEAAFYGTLVAAVGSRYLVFAKVRLLDICADLGRSEISAFNRVSAKHIDFLLCDPRTYRPAVAIELDGASHRRPDRMARDAFVDEVFRGMNVPLIHFPVERNFVAQEIAQRIDAALSGGLF